MVRRRPLRLRSFDYPQPGACFVTVCTARRIHFFGHVVDGQMQLNDAGWTVTQCWLVEAGLPARGAAQRPAPTATDNAHDVATRRRALPEIVRALKSFSARHINEFRNTPGAPVWQRNDYEHVVRSERNLADIRVYIRDNPARWASDSYFSAGEPGVGPGTF